MLIWHWINNYRGGVARFLEELVSAQSELYLEADQQLGVFGPPQLSLPDLVRRLDYHPFGESTWGMNHWKFLLDSSRHIRMLRAKNALIHTHHISFAKPDVHTVHGLYCRDWKAMHRAPFGQAPRLYHRLQYTLVRSMERRMMALSSFVVFASEENRRFVVDQLGINRPDRFRVINHGVDHTRFNPILRKDLVGNRLRYFPKINPHTRWLLFVGNNFQLKGLLRLLESFNNIDEIDEFEPFDFIILGDDQQYIDIARDLSGSIRNGRCHYLSTDSLLTEAYALSDVFLMDSESEAGPLVLLEAMAAGCVPIVTRFGYAEEFIRSGENGWVVENSTAIVKAALELSAVEISAMSESAVYTASRQTWRSVAERYLDIYRESVEMVLGNQSQ